nr:NADH dehydrogenase subunit 2 [Gunungidia aurantiifasciata]
MILNSSKLLFYNTMVIGVAMCICSNNWIMLWAGLEISLMSFLPIMMSKNLLSSECMMKYFIIQSLSSAMFMMGVVFLMLKLSTSLYILMLSLMIKIGVSPFHNWVLSVIEGMTFVSIFILLGFIKISPLIIMSYINEMIFIPIVISLVVGATLGINQNSIRKMLGYSSIFNLGFICSCLSDISIWFMYMMIYMFVLMCVLIMFEKIKVKYMNQVVMNDFDIKSKISFWIMMASFGGIPPMMGFMGKLMVFEKMINTNHMFIAVIMLVSSLIVIFYYTRVSFISIMMMTVMVKWNIFSMTGLSLMMVFINLMMMVLLVFIKIMF